METPDALRNGRVLIALFAVLAVVSAVATVFLLGGGSDELLYAVAGGVGLAIIAIGSYVAGRKYGQPHSHAVAQAGFLLGAVLVASTVAELLMESGILSTTEIVLGLVGTVVGMAILIALIGGLDRYLAAS